MTQDTDRSLAEVLKNLGDLCLDIWIKIKSLFLFLTHLFDVRQ